MESNGVVSKMRVLENFEEVHVLAVDDSFVDRKVIERLLKVLAYKVTAVDSGLRALEYLGLDQQKMPSESDGFIGLKVDLIITDYCMPGMTGYELLKKIKESSTFKEIPVVIMSSENILPRIDRCLEDGAEDFIVKPVKLSDVKRLKDYMTIKEVNGSGGDNNDDGDEDGRVNGSVINKRKFHPNTTSDDVSSSEPPISTKTLSLPSSPSSPLSSSPSISLIESPIRRLKMMGTD